MLLGTLDTIIIVITRLWNLYSKVSPGKINKFPGLELKLRNAHVSVFDEFQFANEPPSTESTSTLFTLFYFRPGLINCWQNISEHSLSKELLCEFREIVHALRSNLKIITILYYRKWNYVSKSRMFVCLVEQTNVGAPYNVSL